MSYNEYHRFEEDDITCIRGHTYSSDLFDHCPYCVQQNIINDDLEAEEWQKIYAANKKAQEQSKPDTGTTASNVSTTGPVGYRYARDPDTYYSWWEEEYGYNTPYHSTYGTCKYGHWYDTTLDKCPRCVEKPFKSKTEGKEDYDIVYTSDELVTVVPVSLEAAARSSKKTKWCTAKKWMYETHIEKGDILFRFLWKGGYKMRLTWNYKNDTFSWGGAASKYYKGDYPEIKSKDISPTPFDAEVAQKNFLDSHKKIRGKYKYRIYLKMFNMINLVPEAAKKKVIEYRENYEERMKYHGLVRDIDNKNVEKKEE